MSLRWTLAALRPTIRRATFPQPRTRTSPGVASGMPVRRAAVRAASASGGRPPMARRASVLATASAPSS
eukprot:5450711-Pyramimonas_sp.AAC.1